MNNYKSPSNKSNLKGQRFGKLTVLEETNKRTKKQLVIYKCRCDCGNIVEVDTNHLTTGHTKSCGCLNHAYKDLTGKTFGKLKVISFNGRYNNYTWWNCRCDCGNDAIVSSASLQNGTTKSYGCLNTQIRSESIKDRFGLIDGTSLANISEKRKINKNNSSGHKGVHYDKQRKKWVAQITFQRKNHNLGRFNTLEEAVEARKKAEELYFEPYRNKE